MTVRPGPRWSLGREAAAVGRGIVAWEARAGPERAGDTRPRGVTLSAISGTTRLVGIIGDPVDHSLSPALHNAAFAALGLDMAYVALPVQGLWLRRCCPRAGRPGVPRRQRHHAAQGGRDPVPDRVRRSVATAEAVNTIVFGSGSRAGHNTDIGGFSRALRERVPEGVAGALGPAGRSRGRRPRCGRSRCSPSR